MSARFEPESEFQKNPQVDWEPMGTEWPWHADPRHLGLEIENVMLWWEEDKRLLHSGREFEYKIPGHVLKLLRRKLNWTQAHLAELIGVTASTVCTLETQNEGSVKLRDRIYECLRAETKRQPHD